MWRFLGIFLIVAVIIFGILWYAGLINLGHEGLARPGSGDPVAAGELYKVDSALPVDARSQPPAAAANAILRRDPLTVFEMILTPANETEISSRIDGRIDKLLVSMGQRVKAGDVLLQLDDSISQEALTYQQMEVDSFGDKLKMKKLMHDVYIGVVARDLKAGAGVALEEREINRARRDQAMYDHAYTLQEQKLSAQKLVKLKLDHEMHKITSNRDGIVVKIYNNRKPGEIIKAGEPLLRVVSTDRLRAEGAVEAHQAALLKVGMKARIEPEVPLTPYKEFRRHTGAITGLAVTPDGLFLASASKDRSIILWNLQTARAAAVLYHEGDEVDAVAAGPVQANDQGQRIYTFLAGCDHARAVLWRITVEKDGKISGKDAVELKDGHRDRLPIRSAAFSEDGKYVATGGEDYQICLWSVADGKLLYNVQERAGDSERAHRGAVTTLHFLQEDKEQYLLSAGTDKLIKKWRLGLARAELKATQKDRSGDVPRLGLTADGKRVLFDAGDELRILDLADWSPVSSLQSRRQNRFSQLAIFSPAGQNVLTVSAGRLQLWAAPGPKDAVDTFKPFELRQLAVPDSAQVTCGVFFAPGEQPGAETNANARSYCFTGGEDRVVRIWEVPPMQEREQPLDAVITYVGSQLERGAGLIQVRAEFDNPKEELRQLKAGAKVNLTIYPEPAQK